MQSGAQTSCPAPQLRDGSTPTQARARPAVFTWGKQQSSHLPSTASTTSGSTSSSSRELSIRWRRSGRRAKLIRKIYRRTRCWGPEAGRMCILNSLAEAAWHHNRSCPMGIYQTARGQTIMTEENGFSWDAVGTLSSTQLGAEQEGSPSPMAMNMLQKGPDSSIGRMIGCILQDSSPKGGGPISWDRSASLLTTTPCLQSSQFCTG